MTGLWNLIKRNCKLFFKDKGMFFSSLITPVILLVLYATFLASVYRDSFASAMPEGFSIDASLIDATVAAQLISSLLAVSCVTVAFCSNLLIVQDNRCETRYNRVAREAFNTCRFIFLRFGSHHADNQLCSPCRLPCLSRQCGVVYELCRCALLCA